MEMPEEPLDFQYSTVNDMGDDVCTVSFLIGDIEEAEEHVKFRVSIPDGGDSIAETKREALLRAIHYLEMELQKYPRS